VTDTIRAERDTLRLALVALLQELADETLPERYGSYRRVGDTHITQAVAAAQAVLLAVPMRTADGEAIVPGSLVWTRARDSLGVGVSANQWQVTELSWYGLGAREHPAIEPLGWQNGISFRTDMGGLLYSSEEAARRSLQTEETP